MRVYAFDIDNTLIARNTLYFSFVNKHPDFHLIEDSMLRAVQRGDAVWIVTANWTYTKNCARKLFRYPELYDRIQFFNGYDIASYIGIPQAVPFVWDIHFQGLKAHFIFRKLIEMDLRKPHYLQRTDLLECILYDDTHIQITQMNAIDSELARMRPWIRLTGVHVPDFLQKPIGNFLSYKLNLDVNSNRRLDTDYRPSHTQITTLNNSYPNNVVDIRIRKPVN